MFLDGLKAKSILRKIKVQVDNRRYEYRKKTLSSIGVIQTETHRLEKSDITQLASDLGIKNENITVITYAKKPSKTDVVAGNLFSEGQVGWNGQPKQEVLKSFANASFDVLLSYYTPNNLVAMAITAFSNAHFKVGLSNEVEGLNDLVIERVGDDVQLFASELKKYLHILKIAI